MMNFLRRTRRNRFLDLLVFVAIVIAILAVLRFLPEPDPVETRGFARIIDGDSIIVGGVEIRLVGIDAPEHAQTCARAGADWPCGREAARRIGNQLRGRVVSCKGQKYDVHDRLLAICVSKGVEINRWMVEQGWAVSYDGFPAAERAARRAKRGIWSGTFMRPRDWREANR